MAERTERSPHKERLRLAINEALADAPPTLTLFSGSWRHPASRSSMGAAVRSLFLFQGRAGDQAAASTLGDVYDPEDIKAVIAGERPALPAACSCACRPSPCQSDCGYGRSACAPAKVRPYARWAKVYNLKQMAAALQFMQSRTSPSMTSSPPRPRTPFSRFHYLTEQLRRTEADLSATSELMGAVVRYAKTRPVFDRYKAAKPEIPC